MFSWHPSPSTTLSTHQVRETSLFSAAADLIPAPAVAASAHHHHPTAAKISPPRRPRYHSFASTPPFNWHTSLRLVTSSSLNEPEYSTSHCITDNLQIDAWRHRSCAFTNLCFNLVTKDFTYHARPFESHVQLNVSRGVFNQKWGMRYDETANVAPRISNQPLPIPRYETLPREIYMAIMPLAPANIGHLIWDDLLASFLTVLSVEPPAHQPVSFRPIWFNAGPNPPWATCDWTRLHEGPGHSLKAGYSLRCLENVKRWLPLLIGPGNDALIETSSWLVNNTALITSDVCFKRLSLGPGSMSNQGSGFHGWNPTDDLAPAAGRGPLIWDFTRLMMNNAGVQDLAAGSLDEIKIFFAEKASNRVFVNFNKHRLKVAELKTELENTASGIVGRKIAVVAQSLNLAKISAKEQIETVRGTAIYVTVAGGGSFSAQFLPRGAAVILYHQSKGDDVHKGLVDYKVCSCEPRTDDVKNKFWNMIGWVRATFIDTVENQNMTLFGKLLKEEVLLAASFLEPLRGA